MPDEKLKDFTLEVLLKINSFLKYTRKELVVIIIDR